MKPSFSIIKGIKIGSIYCLGFAYIWIGMKHFIEPSFFLKIMPPYIPWHIELVYLSGFFEVFLGFFLMIKKYRFYAAWGIFCLLLAVYPANIYLAFNEEPQKAIEISSFLASWVRLPIQFVLLGFAYWHSKE